MCCRLHFNRFIEFKNPEISEEGNEESSHV